MRLLRYRFRLIFVLAAVVALAAYPQNRSKADQPHEMVISHSGDSRVVSISAMITNHSASRLVMPSCGQMLIHKYVVCLPPAFVEQYDGTEWKRVKDKPDHMYGEFAEPILATIEPGGSIRMATRPAREAGYSGVAGIGYRQGAGKPHSLRNASVAASKRGPVSIPREIVF
jgi:hypothetical protein